MAATTTIPARPLLAAVLAALLLSAASAADSKNNPADQLVALINSNRTASKASTLDDNQGLGCIALQYIKAYEGQCNQVGESKKPPETSFAETFAPNCGVQAATLTKITGRLLACQSNYATPDQAFNFLVNDAKSIQVLHSKNHTEVGAAVSGTSGGGPYFWCVLFSSGKPTTSFKVDGGVPKSVRPGCFSGNNDDCMGANAAVSIGAGTWRLVAALLFSAACVFAL
ncbi:uncharacterized protein [Oryza sativa Japonica Group]|uniref:Os08g0459300 protein n=5 Tax=Oryza TaxID=4527 RepID=Q6ZBZ8_ORYSJ|nr:uncharacterized protein LOC4345760 [Oryza sativa Japonica Group]XP_052164156.1 uncharacterized protein LOC127781261 [Oryza glaberrima]KAB8108769.1 hypothetical protein EE612_044713 [Oryza sativa]EEE68811.1 hypothetical protein OsJ_27570 [Oryza sativa Japonica Group]KAB8108770.1 hypothetical protein EE612_044713 [Oryza sativa]KAF2919998.1 hypothetical protein DAI22_08g177300 [Oryza sativa Japonica Group]BAD09597.1 unknown protein [Oryza sativa Japonica Group]|eukprot:NP_001061973.1 Os08g0459300 [Oryza sativa Japonica Group]